MKGVFSLRTPAQSPILPAHRFIIERYIKCKNLKLLDTFKLGASHSPRANADSPRGMCFPYYR